MHINDVKEWADTVYQLSKPKMRHATIDGVEYTWPEAMREAPPEGTEVWFVGIYGVVKRWWDGDAFDKLTLEMGVLQATESGAHAARRALVALMGGTE